MDNKDIVRSFILNFFVFLFLVGFPMGMTYYFRSISDVIGALIFFVLLVVGVMLWIVYMLLRNNQRAIFDELEELNFKFDTLLEIYTKKVKKVKK